MLLRGSVATAGTSASRAALPLLVASAKSRSWSDVLRVYQEMCGHLQGIYTPTPQELKHGFAQMPSSWATTLFYYSVVKPVYGQQRPDHDLVSEALMQFKRAGNLPAMQRVFAEDINTHTPQGARATLVLAAYTGMWQQALAVTEQHPKLKSSLANRRTLITALSSAGQVALALRVLQEDRSVDPSPVMIRPIVKRLALDGEHAAALRLASASFAAGYALNTSLFSGLLRSLRETGQSGEALEVALDLNLFATPRDVAQRNIATFNGLVDCLYEMDPYAATYSVEEVVREMLSRMSPREVVYRTAHRRRQLRLCTVVDIHNRFAKYAMPLSQLYARCLGVPRWHSRPLTGIVDAATASDATVLVLDTNFLLQCVSKNLPLEHFRGAMERQHPHLVGRKGGAVVVVPFTAIQEAYSVIWNPANHVRHSVKLLLWSRVVAMVRQPAVHVLSLTAELPAMSLSLLTRMAYAKTLADRGADGGVHEGRPPRDPDARLLNVCLLLHHIYRARAVGAAQSVSVPEGTTLFAFLKYHVRRYTNTVKGSACDRVLLCTMDRKLARAATEAGVDCFPAVR